MNINDQDILIPGTNAVLIGFDDTDKHSYSTFSVSVLIDNFDVKHNILKFFYFLCIWALYHLLHSDARACSHKNPWQAYKKR